jgi:flagellar assembly protein FliH
MGRSSFCALETMTSSSSAAEVLRESSVPRAWTLVDLLEAAESLDGSPVTGAPESEDEQAEQTLFVAALGQEERRGERAEWESRVSEAYRSGFEEGRQEGEMMEQARLRRAVHAAESALEELRLGEARWTGTIEENVSALAVIIARQVIGRELALGLEPVLNLVRAALTEFPIDQPIRIRVNPNDLNAISRESADGDSGMLSLTRDRQARWVGDAAIAPGGCMVEGRERIIDGRVDLALERVYRRLTYTNA